MTVIYGGYSGHDTRLVIENGFDYVRLGACDRHVRRHGAPKIVESPIGSANPIVKAIFESPKA